MKLFQKKSALVRILLFVILVLGIGLIIYTLINIEAQSIHTINQKSNIEVFSLPRIKQPYKLVRNEIILKPLYPIINIKEDVILKVSKPLYTVNPVKSETIGTLLIPALERELPIVEGTGKEELKLGVGHFSGSVLPGMNDNCVLSGHRETVFANLDKLKIGQQLIVTTSAGLFTYEITNIRIVDKDDRSVIVPLDHAVLTLTTCYPFNIVGTAPQRYIVSGDLKTKIYTVND